MTDDPAARVEALEALLVEKGLVDPAVVDEVIEHYETNVGPLNGAKVVARAWIDPAYKDAPARRRHGRHRRARLRRRRGRARRRGREHARRCTTSSSARCARATRGRCSACRRAGTRRRPTARAWCASRARCCAEIGLDLPDDVEIRVWDSSRRGALPRRCPSGRRAPRASAEEELERAGHARRDDRRGPGAGARCLTRSPTTSRRRLAAARQRRARLRRAVGEAAFGLAVALCRHGSAATGRTSASA